VQKAMKDRSNRCLLPLNVSGDLGCCQRSMFGKEFQYLETQGAGKECRGIVRARGHVSRINGHGREHLFTLIARGACRYEVLHISRPSVGDRRGMIDLQHYIRGLLSAVLAREIVTTENSKAESVDLGKTFHNTNYSI
jgi:hypothetical protein